MAMSRRVLVTGAGSGLGRALAFRYAEAGWRVACADIRFERAQETVGLITGFGIGAMAIQVDVGNDASFEALRDEVLAAWDGVELVINNAGVASAGPLLTASMDEWQWMLNVNLLGVVRGCRLFLPGMVAAGHGQVINTASFAGLAGAPNIMSYGVTKAAVVALSEQLRAEVQDKGIGVSVVCPSFFRTNLLESWQGNDRMKAYADKMMANSPDTLDSVADAAFAAAERGQFLILPTHKSPMLWRLKRWLPDFYFRNMLKVANRATKGA